MAVGGGGGGKDTGSRMELLLSSLSSVSLGEFDVAFTGEKKRTMFFDTVLVQGMWRLVLSVYHFDTKNVFSVGVIRPANVEGVLKGIMGQKPHTGLGCHLWSDCASIDNNDGSTTTVSPEYRGVEGAPIAVEVDMDLRTLHFFNGGRKIPYSIARLPSSLQFGFSSSCAPHLVRFVSLSRLGTPSLDGCERIEWMDCVK